MKAKVDDKQKSIYVLPKMSHLAPLKLFKFFLHLLVFAILTNLTFHLLSH